MAGHRELYSRLNYGKIDRTMGTLRAIGANAESMGQNGAAYICSDMIRFRTAMRVKIKP